MPRLEISIRVKNRIKRSGQAQLAYVKHKPLHLHHVKVSPRGLFPKTQALNQLYELMTFDPQMDQCTSGGHVDAMSHSESFHGPLATLSCELGPR